MENVLKLIEDSRYLRAQIEYEQLIQTHPNEINLQIETKLTRKCTQIKHALKMTSKTSSSDITTSPTGSSPNWILATHLLGVQTHYLLDEDGSLWVKMESTQYDVPLMEQLAVVYEVSLFNKWIPFCSDSSLVARLNHVEVISYSAITALGFCRDVVVYSYGADCLYENGSIVVIGSSIDEYPGVEIPPVKGYFSKRATLQFNAVVTPFSPTSGHMIVVAKIDPKLSLPTTIINFTTKQIAGFFLVMINQQAREIEHNEDSPYREFIQNNPEFYLHWILPKLRAYIAHNGWKQPNIACLGEHGIYREEDLIAPPPSVDNPLPSSVSAVSAVSDAPVSPPQPVFYPYIEGSLYKKGNGIISSVWSYRHFELDINEQTLRWFKLKQNTSKQNTSSTSSSNQQRIERGVISLRFCSAELLTDKKKKSKYSKMISGEVFIIKYYLNSFNSTASLSDVDSPGNESPIPPLNRSTSASSTNEGTETESISSVSSSKSLNHPTGSIQEMYLSAPCLDEALHWIHHINLSSKIHLKETNPFKQSKKSSQPSQQSSQLPLQSSQQTQLQQAQLQSQLQQSHLEQQHLEVNPLRDLLLKYHINPLLIYFLPLIPLLFPFFLQVYVAIALLYWIIANIVKL